MKWLVPWLAAACWLSAQAPPAQPVPAPGGAPEEGLPAEVPAANKTVSASDLFVIHGSTLPVRGAFASLAETVRQDLVREVGEAKSYRKNEVEYKNAIVIEVYGREFDKAPPRLISRSEHETDGGFRLQLNVHLAKGLPPELERALLERIIAERGVRKPRNEQVQIEVSPWLLDGLTEAIRWRKGDRDRALYSALFSNNQLFPVEKLLAIEDPDELDAVARSAFRASAGALVMALLGQPQGRSAMNALLEEASVFLGEDEALLLEHFPGMNLGKGSLEKWWALQLARMAEIPLSQTMTIQETEKELERLLVVRFTGPDGNMIEVPAEAFRDLLAVPMPVRQEAIRPVVDTVGLMSFRAFPAHRPIIVGYMHVLTQIGTDKDEHLDANLATLADERQGLLDLGERTRDYLDWYRITNASETSGEFRDYIELKEKLDTGRSRAESPMSRYLDDLQSYYGER